VTDSKPNSTGITEKPTFLNIGKLWRQSLAAMALLCVTPLTLADTAAGATAASASASTNGGAIAMLMVLAAVLCAVFLNFKVAKIRALGSLLAGIICLALVAWFVVVLNSGVLENPKPNQTPMDSAKPLLLWLQTGVALVSGLALVLTAFKQSKNTDALELGAANKANRFGQVSRLLHWSTAILFISLFPLGIFQSMIPVDGEYRAHYSVIHKSIGLLALILLVIRIIWHKLSKPPELDSELKPRDRKLAHIAHLCLYGLMILMPITGYMMTSFHGYSSYFFGIVIEPFWPESKAYIVWGLFHKYILQYLLYIILGAHILGALKHHFVDKHKKSITRILG